MELGEALRSRRMRSVDPSNENGHRYSSRQRCRHGDHGHATSVRFNTPCFLVTSTDVYVHWSSGRLNVLANVTRKPLEELFCQFDPKLEPSDVSVSVQAKGTTHLSISFSYRIEKIKNGKSYVIVSVPTSIGILFSPSMLRIVTLVHIWRTDLVFRTHFLSQHFVMFRLDSLFFCPLTHVQLRMFS